jgi:hypothetical protein
MCVMDHKEKSHLKLVYSNDAEPELDSVAAQIQPLSEEITPSEEFLATTRLRLLKLERTAPSNGSQRAA